MFNCRACEVDTPVRFSPGGRLVSHRSNDSHNRIASNGVYSFLYDNEGKITSKTLIATRAVTEYTWDHRNRLTKVVEKISLTGATTKVVRYVYDAFDRKVAKQLDRDGNGTIDIATRWVYDGAHAALEWEDSDGAGSAQPYRLSNRFLYGDAVDMLLADEQYASGQGLAVGSTSASTQAGLNLWTLGDHFNSIRDLVDNNGIVRQHVNYDRFGQRIREVDRDASNAIISSSNAAAIDELFGYTGRDWDTDTNLQYNRARWYDPAQGRWLSQDPIGFEAGDANLYRYVGNEPTRWIDPSGHRKVGSHPVTGTGHHLVPVELWDQFGFDESIYKMLDDANIPAPDHNFRAHGSVTGYTGYVNHDLRGEIKCYTDKFGKGGVLTIEQQKEFVQQYLDRIRTGKAGKYITEFNNVVGKGRDAVLEWWNETGHKIKWYTEKPPFKIKGAKLLGPAITVVSSSLAAKRGYAGEGRYCDGGAVGAYVEVGADLMMADEVEDYVLKPAGSGLYYWIQSIFPFLGSDEPSLQEKRIRDALGR